MITQLAVTEQAGRAANASQRLLGLGSQEWALFEPNCTTTVRTVLREAGIVVLHGRKLRSCFTSGSTSGQTSPSSVALRPPEPTIHQGEPIVGVTVGTWHFDETPGDLPGDEPSAIAAIAHRLEAETGLRVEQQHEGRTLRIPTLGEALFDWAFSDRTISVLGFLPEHPYLWENLDVVMAAAGGRRDAAAHVWQPNPAHARLRTRWDDLSPRDRFLLRMPSLLAARPFDRLLSQTAR